LSRISDYEYVFFVILSVFFVLLCDIAITQSLTSLPAEVMARRQGWGLRRSQRSSKRHKEKNVM